MKKNNFSKADNNFKSGTYCELIYASRISSLFFLFSDSLSQYVSINNFGSIKLTKTLHHTNFTSKTLHHTFSGMDRKTSLMYGTVSSRLLWLLQALVALCDGVEVCCHFFYSPCIKKKNPPIVLTRKRDKCGRLIKHWCVVE